MPKSCMMFCLSGHTIHTFTCLIDTMCKAVDRCQTTFLFQGEFQPWEDFASLSSRSGRAFPSPRLNTSFRRTCSLSVYETTSMGNRHQLYKPPQVRLISHRTSYSPPAKTSPSFLCWPAEVQLYIIQCLLLSTWCLWWSCWWLQCAWLMPRRGLRCVGESWYVWPSHPVVALA